MLLIRIIQPPSDIFLAKWFFGLNIQLKRYVAKCFNTSVTVSVTAISAFCSLAFVAVARARARACVCVCVCVCVCMCVCCGISCMFLL